MKKLTLLLIMLVVGMSSAYAQAPYDDFVDEVRGDTLVVKTYTDMGQEPNAINNAIGSDTVDVPEGRVYELKRDGWYPLLNNLVLPATRPMVIAGQGSGSLVQQTLDDGYPPVISGIFIDNSNSNNGQIRYNSDTILKNVSITPTNTGGGLGWALINAASAGNHLTLDNVMIENTRWIFMQSNAAENTSMTVKNSYFVNMTGQTCRRNGGVYDNTNYNTTMVHVENTTHIMGSGIIYKFRSFPFNKAVFNHNTFVNMSGQVFASFGHQNDYTVTNNLFVNSNVQAYIPGLDIAELDQDRLPHGLINIDTLRYIDADGNEQLGIDSTWITTTYDMDPSEFGPDNRHVLVSHNGIYWNDRVSEIPAALNDANTPCPPDEGTTVCKEGEDTWVTQAMTMNSRTQAMFDDGETYRYLQEGPWVNEGDPSFADPAGLVDGDAFQDMIDWSIAAATTPDAPMAHWRAADNPFEGEGLVFSDFPVLADLSYSNSAYLTASTDGQPLGDLNWFPAEKATFMDNYEAHYAALRTALESGEPVGTSNERTELDVPNSIELNQNYPNPFNPTTSISFNLPKSQEITLKVYDMLGREVATLVNKEQYAAGQSMVNFDASSLASGMYIYRLTSNNVTISKKMTLIK